MKHIAFALVLTSASCQGMGDETSVEAVPRDLTGNVTMTQEVAVQYGAALQSYWVMINWQGYFLAPYYPIPKPAIGWLRYTGSGWNLIAQPSDASVQNFAGSTIPVAVPCDGVSCPVVQQLDSTSFRSTTQLPRALGVARAGWFFRCPSGALSGSPFFLGPPMDLANGPDQQLFYGTTPGLFQDPAAWRLQAIQCSSTDIAWINNQYNICFHNRALNSCFFWPDRGYCPASQAVCPP